MNGQRRDRAGLGKSGARTYYFFWLLLALPAVWLVAERLRHAKVAYVPLTGDIAGWILIVTLMITPLTLLLGPLPWLKARRRYLGVASCLYGGLHLAFWLRNADLHQLIRSFLRPSIVTGWVALIVLVLLALTSTDSTVARMGTGWKRLQRWVYPAAVLTLAHWLMTTDNKRLAVASALPLVLLSLWRIWRTRNRMTRST